MSDRVVDVGDQTGTVGESLVGEIGRAAEWVLGAEGVEAAELSVALVSDDAIAGMNQQYLSHGGPTDVISFPLDGVAGRVVGDIYIGVEQARRQAAEVGVEAREELLRLAVHGTLHVLGWEHPDEEAARSDSPMYRLQEALLAGFLASQR